MLLDPANLLRPARVAAAGNTRTDQSYVSFEEGVDRRYREHADDGAARPFPGNRVGLLPDDHSRFRYRYCQSAVVAAYGEMSGSRRPSSRSGFRPCLLGDTSYIPYDHLLHAHDAALGDLLQAERIAAGHSLWDALDDTVGAVELS